MRLKPIRRPSRPEAPDEGFVPRGFPRFTFSSAVLYVIEIRLLRLPPV
jgi:hypothetical protein